MLRRPLALLLVLAFIAVGCEKEASQDNDVVEIVYWPSANQQEIDSSDKAQKITTRQFQRSGRP